MKLSQFFAPTALALTTGLTATSAMGQATACVNGQCVTGPSSASIHQDGTYIYRNGVHSGTSVQSITPAQPYRQQHVVPAAAAKPLMDVYSFTFEGKYKEWVCRTDITNTRIARDLTELCHSTAKQNLLVAYNRVNNPFRAIASPLNARVFCDTRPSGNGGVHNPNLPFDKTFYQAGEEMGCIRITHDFR